jgi:DNA repair exonuclease SbcCD ATPase subunit
MCEQRLCFIDISPFFSRPRIFLFCPIPSKKSINKHTFATMSGRGSIQNKLSHIMSLIKAEGYKIEDVIPQEMQDHFSDMAALKEARQYITEIESREKQLQAENVDLSARLLIKETEITNLPEEFKALKIDLAQAQRRGDYYKELAENAQTRAERSQSRLTDLAKTQAATQDDARKIQRLESELADHAAAMFKLLEENRALKDLQDTQQEQEHKLVDEKNAQIADLVNQINMLEVEKLEAVELSEKVSETYDTLIQSIEEETLTAADVLNRHSVSLVDMVKSNDQLYSTIATEIVPLNSFFDHAFSIMAIYQAIFQDLVDPNCTAIADLPQALDTTLDAANEDLLRFQVVSTALQNEGLAQERIRRQVADMAQIAARMYITLDGIRKDVSDFLNLLRSNPNAWLVMKRLEGTPQASSPSCETPTPSMSSPRSSISSFVSLKKRFSFASSVNSAHTLGE